MRIVGKKGFSLLGIGLWSNIKRSGGLMSPDLPCSRVKNQVNWLPEYTQWPGFFSPCGWYWYILRWHCHNSSGSNGTRFVHGARDTWIGHRRVQDLNPTENLWDVLETTAQRPDSPIINTRAWWKINATLDGNKCLMLYWISCSKRCHGICVL